MPRLSRCLLVLFSLVACASRGSCFLVVEGTGVYRNRCRAHGFGGDE